MNNLGQMSHFGGENYVSLWLWIRFKEFLKTLQSERGREVDESYMNGFSKKNSFRTIGPFGTKNCASLQLWICCKDFFYTMKEAKVHMEVMLMDFLKPRILNNSRSALRTSLKFCTMKETKRHFKIILMGFF